MSRQTGPAMHPDPLNILEGARRSTKGYNSHATWEVLANAVKVAFNQNTPRDFQLDVAEALILGLDATVVAGTGSGKTLPWVMPLLLDENIGRSRPTVSMKSRTDLTRPAMFFGFPISTPRCTLPYPAAYFWLAFCDFFRVVHASAR